MRIYIIVSVVFFSNCIYEAQAQSGAGLPVQFIQFFKTYSLINPASIGKDSAIEFSTGNKSLTGAFSGVRTFYANANVQLNARGKNKSKHVLGLTFINDKEGSFINRNRASLVYAFHLPISKKSTVSAGVSAGFINYSYKASNISAGGSAFAPNADIGLWLHRSNFNIGVSGNQIIASKLTPIDETYTIERHYNLTADRTFLLGPYLTLTPAFIFRWYDQEYYNADLALILLIQDQVTTALSYKYDRGVSVSGGLEDVKLGRNVWKVMFSYYFPLGSVNNYNPSAYELSLCFIPGVHRRGSNNRGSEMEEEE
ncbi:MAG: type IX secretion system membrane protein PorP/SprF [Cytophagaceae bacterium]|nr:type IX secretion system membrane protein PorP/SprF [Cytophagaceae bacterium]